MAQQSQLVTNGSGHSMRSTAGSDVPLARVQTARATSGGVNDDGTHQLTAANLAAHTSSSGRDHSGMAKIQNWLDDMDCEHTKSGEAGMEWEAL
ncbi:hypothetical protein LTR09_003688 [Extremus antarcticus]|uniref:Uncharacterized protein n=1 Tax=Extremus antarcticus TaxID=702011 RepID=A0AAJ0GA35_9PEZI|nr:hypothetical protein LTR09_003688 [Extremus antarcticus]